MDNVTLDGYSLSFSTLLPIAEGASVTVDPLVKERVDTARALVERLAGSETPYYGINTGFGYFANTKIAASEQKRLQENIVRSHAGGRGDSFSTTEIRLAMALRLNLLIKGLSGVRYELCERLLKLLELEIYPVVPEYGSVGASGDLIPLAHLALGVLGEGEVFFKGRRMPAPQALQEVGLEPVRLAEKEGLCLVNGTEFMQSVGGLALSHAITLLGAAEKIAALSFEALSGILTVLDPRIHAARGQRGQIASAAALREELVGSSLWKEERPSGRTQDPYSLRCSPQVLGPTREAFQYVRSVVERELNAVTDNPLVFLEDESIVSGGNFHGQALALAYDFAAIACAEIANISERRLDLLSNPHFSGVGAFGSPEPGLDSGYMVLQYLSACSVNENKVLSHPASTDSIPGLVGVEDHVSMGMTSARKLRKIVENVKSCLAAELLAAAQVLYLKRRDEKTMGAGTSRTLARLRRRVPPLKEDRVVAGDVAEAIEVVSELCSEARVLLEEPLC